MLQYSYNIGNYIYKILYMCYNQHRERWKLHKNNQLCHKKREIYEHTGNYPDI